MSQQNSPTLPPLLLGHENKSGENWRRETEARAVLRWPLLQRQEFLREVERRRGQQAAAILKADLILLFNLTRRKSESGSTQAGRADTMARTDYGRTQSFMEPD